MSAFHKVIDVRGISVAIPPYPMRIVSLICSITETLFELGLEERVVGRTNYCIRPKPAVETAKKIGGPKNPDLDAVLALNPDLVIANIEENEKHDIEQLEKKGIPVFVTYPKTVADSLELIKTLGCITGKENEAELWYERAKHEIHKTTEQVQSFTKHPSVIYLIWRKPYMAVNRETYIHDMITLCGGINLYEDHPDRYPAITIKDIIEKQPEILFLPSEPFPFQAKHIKEFLPCTGIPAIRNHRVLLVDGELFSWYGIRMIYGLPYVRKLIDDFCNNSM